MSFTMNNRSTGRLRASLRRRAALTAAVSALGLYCAQAQAVSILFIGNSFTYGAGSDVQTYNPGSVTDLNGTGIGGVPALFKSFAVQAGLDYDVSLETQPGSNLDFHYDNRLGLISQAWDRVVMHGQSTLDFANPGDPTKITTYANLLAQEFVSHNPAVEVNLMATWSRADQTYLPTGHWYGQPISAMQADVQAGYQQAAFASPLVNDRLIKVGAAWNRAMEAGVADPNPYDGIAPGMVSLWADDEYHASQYGSYLEALTIFGTLTGVDPRTLGASEQAAMDLGIAPDVAVGLQNVAYAQITAIPEPSTWLLMGMGSVVLVFAARRRARPDA